MTEKRTDKEVLAKGIKTLSMALIAISLGPLVLYNAFMNKEHAFFIPVVILGVLILFVAIFLILKGLKLILNSLFD